MKKVEAPLKWMAEKRARVAGNIAKLERVQRAYLAEAAEVLQALRPIQQRAKAVFARMAVLREDLDALDHAIRIYDPTRNPADIPSIRAFAGRYGERGSLKAYVSQVLQSADDWVASDTCSALVREHFDLKFETPALLAHWERNSLRQAFRLLSQAGLIECDKPDGPIGIRKSWRWKQSRQPTLAELRQQAARIETVERPLV